MNQKKLLFRNKILRELYYEGSLSCVELSKRIPKSFPITAGLIDELKEENLIIENGFAQSTGGRRPITYSIRKNVMFLVSVAMDQFVTKIGVMDMQHNFVSEIEKIDLPLQGNLHALGLLEEAIARVIDSSGIEKEKFIGVGIGMPGFVDVKKGVNYSYLQLPNNKSITKHIGEKTGLPVFIDNDSSLIALAEFYFGSAKGETNAMVVNVGWGIGLGMILNGALFRGNEGFAGEFSHIPLFFNGKSCWCGKVGCLETETSLSLIIDRAREEINSERLSKLNTMAFGDMEEAFDCIINAVTAGDQFAVGLFSKAGYNIGRGLAILIHILNPKKIVLSGRGSAAGQVWLAPIQQALNEQAIPRLRQGTEIEISELGINAELIGAAALVMENYEREGMIHKAAMKLEEN